MGFLNRGGLYWRSLRHLQFRQVAWRLRYLAARRLGVTGAPPLQAPPPRFHRGALAALREYAALRAELLPPREEELSALREGRFRFIGQSLAGDGAPPWHAGEMPRLWRYLLHYHLFARDFALSFLRAPKALDRDRALSWIHDWIARNPPGSDVAWDAFTVSERLLHWSVAAAVFGIQDPAIRAVYAQQAGFLERRREHDLQGNHLLKNAAALSVAGAMLGSPLRERGAALLREQVQEQILPDGGHYERSPMYHALALEDLLLAYVALGAGGNAGGKERPERPAFLLEAIARMSHWLERMTHADGEIPMFGDSVLGVAPPPGPLNRLARRLCALPEEGARSEPSWALPRSGYYALGLRGTPGRMLVRAGSPGPAHQLGHAHCDQLSYELTLGARRVIVDSGMCAYQDAAWREYGRSTRAHNVVQAGEREQMECWALFRVGRRYTPEPVHWSVDGGTAMLRGGHDGFAPHVHRRACAAYMDEGWWLVVDEVAGPEAAPVSSYLHFAPGTRLKCTAKGVVIASGAFGRLRVLPFDIGVGRIAEGEEAPLQGWHSPRFGEAFPAPVLILSREAGGPGRFGYALLPGDAGEGLTPKSLRERAARLLPERAQEG